MSNFHPLTKRADTGELAGELLAAGVTSGIGIDNVNVYLGGDAWDAMDADAKAAELALVAETELAHTPTTKSEATLAAAPHVGKLLEECSAVSGVTGLGVELPESYPGTAYLTHDSLTLGERANLVAAAEAHDATTVPSLAVDIPSQVVGADGIDTGAVVITDSRGAAVNGNTIKIRIPVGGGAAINGDSFALAGAGQATVLFQTTTTFTGELEFEAYDPLGVADPVKFIVRRGSA